MSKRRTGVFLNEKELEKRMRKKLQTRKKSPNNVPLFCLKWKSSSKMMKEIVDPAVINHVDKNIQAKSQKNITSVVNNENAAIAKKDFDNEMEIGQIKIMLSVLAPQNKGRKQGRKQRIFSNILNLVLCFHHTGSLSLRSNFHIG